MKRAIGGGYSIKEAYWFFGVDGSPIDGLLL